MANTLRQSLLVLGALATACGGSDGADPQNPIPTNTNTRTEVVIDSLSLQLGSLDVSIALGGSADLTVDAQYSDGTTRDLTNEATWASSNENAARFVSPGQLVTVGTGVTILTVTYEDMSASHELIVQAPTATALELDPAVAIRGIGAEGGGVQITARATLSDNSIIDVTEEVFGPDGDWTSSNPLIGVMSAGDVGRLSLFGTQLGEVVISARYQGLEATGRYVATGPVIEEIRFIDDRVRVQIGEAPVTFSVEGRRSDGTMVDITNDVTLTMDDETIATFNGNQIFPVMAGNTRLTASYTVSEGGLSTDLTANAEIRVVDEAVGCPYPEHTPTLAYDAAIAPHMYLNAFDEAGNNVDLSLADVHCDPAVSTIAFVIGAGWCPHCPAFKEVVDNASAELEELGMQVVYVEIQTNTGAPATHAQANDIVNRSPRIGKSTRVGARTEENVGPFDMTPSLPNLVVVRTSDMKVIRRGRRDDLANMAANPGSTYGDGW